MDNMDNVRHPHKEFYIVVKKSETMAFAGK